MRITDRSPTGRLLQTIFFPAEPKPVMPSEVSDEIVLTHPAAPPMVGLKEGRFFFSAATSAAGVTESFGPLVPTDRYWWVQMLHLFHNDTATDRLLRLEVEDTSANRCTVLAPQSNSAPQTRLVLERPFLLPNDTRFRASVSAIGAAFTVTLAFFFLEFLHAEINPSA